MNTWPGLACCMRVDISISCLGSRCVPEKLHWKPILGLKNKSLKWLEVKKFCCEFFESLVQWRMPPWGAFTPQIQTHRHSFLFNSCFFSCYGSLFSISEGLKWGIHPTFTAKCNNSPLQTRGRFYIFDDQLIQLITVGRSQCSFPYNQCLPPSCEPRREGPLGEIHGGGCPSEALGFLCEHPRAACSSSPAIAMRPQGVCTLGSNTSSILGKCSVSHLSPPQPWLSSPGITLTWLLVGTVCWACA